MKIDDLPNPFLKSAVSPAAGRPTTAALFSSSEAAVVAFSSREVSATTAPGMARDVIETPASLKRDANNNFQPSSVTE